MVAADPLKALLTTLIDELRSIDEQFMKRSIYSHDRVCRVAEQLQDDVLLALGERQETAEPPQDALTRADLNRWNAANTEANDLIQAQAAVISTAYAAMDRNHLMPAFEILERGLSLERGTCLAAHREGPATAETQPTWGDVVTAGFSLWEELRPFVPSGQLDNNPPARQVIERHIGQAMRLSAHREGRPPAAETELMIAERIARSAHEGQKDTVTGEPYITHVERVVAMVEGAEAKAVAWLHDVLEDTQLTSADLVRAGISDGVREAVERLTRGDEPYSEYISTIHVCGPVLARVVKIADLRDHLHPNCPARLRPRYEKALSLLSAVAGHAPASETPRGTK